jgi:hypothetical protein
MNQLLPLTESEALFAPFQDPFLSRQMDFTLVPAAGVSFRSEINWDSVYVKCAKGVGPAYYRFFPFSPIMPSKGSVELPCSTPSRSTPSSSLCSA